MLLLRSRRVRQREAEGELAALAPPCHKTDVCMLFGPNNPVEVEVT
jgi:hypothetical protein